MQLNLQKFTQTNSRYENRITVTKSNSFGFPTQFYKDNGLKEMKYVVLYYDEENAVIGLKFTNNQEQGTFSIVHSKQGYGGSAVATSFFNAKKIPTAIYYGRYEWTKKAAWDLGLNDEGSLFLIELKKHEDKLKGAVRNEPTITPQTPEF